MSTAARKVELGDLANAGEEWRGCHADITAISGHHGDRGEVGTVRQRADRRLVANHTTPTKRWDHRRATACCPTALRQRVFSGRIRQCVELLGQHRTTHLCLLIDNPGYLSIFQRLPTAALRHVDLQKEVFPADHQLPSQPLLAVGATMEHHLCSDRVGRHLAPHTPHEQPVGSGEGFRDNIPLAVRLAARLALFVGEQRGSRS